MNPLHQELIQIGNRILSISRSELYLSMRFLDLALSSLSYDLNLQTRTIATDGVHIFYNPNYLVTSYEDDPVGVNRTYLHMILHCIFRHMTQAETRDLDDWNLACDIAVESILDSMEYPCVHRLVRDRRQEYYDSLNLSVLNAEQIYDVLVDMPYIEKMAMQKEFLADDHKFWEQLQDEEQKNQPQQRPDGGSADTPPPDRDEVDQKWQDISQKTQTSMETFHRELNLMAGNLQQQLQIENRMRYDYRAFLRKFAVIREEVRLDPDSFDYGFYNYSMQLYENMPMLEELEYRESKKIHDFVIAVDTSGSCSGELVRRFLEQTVSMLLDSGNFFRSVNVHIIQCDADIQSDLKITDTTHLHDVLQTFDVKGNGDTDFRPVFRYVEQLQQQGELIHLQGMLFFTDGFGIYPQKRPPYDVAFLFLDNNYAEHMVPPWAMKLVLSKDDIAKGF
ncbi:MAG: VWA-like domain-containing protein [Clostridia bacterium]|nr:VWA-like domain-containing protein [Clostridia bacterium]